jgi:hypothetical protein
MLLQSCFTKSPLPTSTLATPLSYLYDLCLSVASLLRFQEAEATAGKLDRRTLDNHKFGLSHVTLHRVLEECENVMVSMVVWAVVFGYWKYGSCQGDERLLFIDVFSS